MNRNVTETIIGCAFKVHNTLGSGFLEKVYENALYLELKKVGTKVKKQVPVTVKYMGAPVGEYYVDLLVEDCCLVELKAVKKIDEVHYAQVLNYLRATGLKTSLLLNFGSPRLEIKRLSL